GLPELLRLPTDHPRPPVASLRGSAVEFDLPADLHGRVVATARQANATPFMVLHAALAILLSRLSGTNDIAVGTPTAGRGAPELDDVIGMFVNTLVLRSRLSPRQTFAELLAATRENDLLAFGHADVPFEQVVEAINPPRSTAHLPLYQVSLDVQDLSAAALRLPGLVVEAIEDGFDQAQADLNVKLTQRLDADGRPDGMIGRLTYATDLFTADTMSRFARAYLRILDEVTAERSVVVGDIDLLDPRERRALLAASGTPGARIPDVTLDDLFTARVAACPDAVAVTDGDTAVTYAELD